MGLCIPLTEARVLLTSAATGSIWGWVSMFNGAKRQLCSLTPPAQLQFCAWNRRIAPWNWRRSSPLRSTFSSSHELSWLYERWCLFLLACPRRRWATDFTHFYWLIWLCSCQQLRGSQESEMLRDSSAATTSDAALWLELPGGRQGGSHLSHNK